jgi:Tol biopolymer transport system component
MNADHTHRKQLTHNPPSADDIIDNPTWSADGKTLLFGDIHPDGIDQIKLIGIDGNHERVIWAATDERNGLPAGGQVPEWSPDGSLIAFIAGPQTSSGRTDIYVVRPDGSGLRRLTRDANATALSWRP